MLGWASRASSASLPAKPGLPDSLGQRETEKLDGDFSLEAPIVPPGQPHGAHPALPQWLDQGILANPLARE